MKHIVEEHCFLNLPAFPVDVCNGTGHKTTALTGNVPETDEAYFRVALLPKFACISGGCMQRNLP